MFDACDPMLEVRLAETTEAMLSCLQEPTSKVTQPPPSGADKRIEVVTLAEMKVLPSKLTAADHAVPDLDAGLSAECLAVLADACGSGHEGATAGATTMLREHFGIHSNAAALAALAELTTTLQADLANGRSADDLAALCERISATVAAHLTPADSP